MVPVDTDTVKYVSHLIYETVTTSTIIERQNSIIIDSLIIAIWGAFKVQELSQTW